jgi:porin
LASVLLGVRAAPAPAQDSATTAQPSLSAAYSYTGVLQSNVAGGSRRGMTFGGAAALQLTLTLDQLVPWRGAQIFLFLLDTHGGMPTDLVGALQAVSGIEAPPGLRVEELWIQQNAFANRLSLLVGRYDVNTEFYRLQSTALFVHSSLGIGPEFAQSGVEGPSTFPYTAVGARADFKPSANLVWRAAVVNGTPVDRPGGGARLFARGDGILLMGEVATLDRADTANLPRDRRFQIGRGVTRPYERKIALGVWHYTATFADLVDTLPNGSAVQHRGSSGVYLIADQSLWRASGGGPRVLAAFAQLGIGDSRVNRVCR